MSHFNRLTDSPDDPSYLAQVPETNCYILYPPCDLSFRIQMKIISYHHKNHLLDDIKKRKFW